MPVSGLVDLSNQLNQLMAGLEKMGLVKVTPGKPAEAIDKTKIN